MAVHRLLAAAGVMLLGGVAVADDVRYVQEGGTLYRETRRTVQRPVVETRTQEVTRTVYCEQVTTETREQVRTYYTPVTEYVYESYVANRWNPFATPYVAYRTVPRTRWECRTETCKVPVTCRRLVPRTETVQQPVTTLRMASEEVVSRTAVSGPATVAASSPGQPAGAPRQEIGGIARLDKGSPWGSAATASRPTTLR